MKSLPITIIDAKTGKPKVSTVPTKIVHYAERVDYRERRDCTVRATAAALAVPYVLAHAKLAELGRKPRRGFKFNIGHIGHLFTTREDLCAGTVGKTLENIRRESGRFVVKVRQHVFAVVDGEPWDMVPVRSKMRVRMVYQAI